MKIPIKNYYNNGLNFDDEFKLFIDEPEKTYTVVITRDNQAIGISENIPDISIFNTDKWNRINEIANELAKHGSWISCDSDESYKQTNKNYRDAAYFFTHNGFWRGEIDNDVQICTAEDICNIVYKKNEKTTVNIFKKWLKTNDEIIAEHFKIINSF